VTVGTAGANLEAGALMLVSAHQHYCLVGGFSDQRGNWSVAHTEQYGYTLVEVDNDSMNVQV
jgi:hypothetical protein